MPQGGAYTPLCKPQNPAAVRLGGLPPAPLIFGVNAAARSPRGLVEALCAQYSLDTMRNSTTIVAIVRGYPSFWNPGALSMRGGLEGSLAAAVRPWNRTCCAHVTFPVRCGLLDVSIVTSRAA